MSDAELTCPFCNARVPALPGLSAGARVSCPRCDEVFPLEGGRIQAAPGLTAAPSLKAPAATSFVSSSPAVMGQHRRSNRLVAGIVLSVMLLMALTGLTYALLTQHVRRQHDKSLPRLSRRPALPPLRKNPEPETAAPARLAGLGYLPARTSIIVGLQVQELLNAPAGKGLRTRALKFGNIELRLDALRDWTGLDVDDIDHAVLGVLDVAEVPPPTHLVVRTRRPFNANQLRTALKARKARQAKAADGEERTLYSGTVRGLPVTLWLPDNRTVVMGLFSDLEAVPAQPNAGIDHLPAPLRSLLEQRLSGGMALWAVGHAEDWKKTWLPVLLAGFKDVPGLARLEQVRSFAVGVLPEKPLKLQGAFHCVDEAAAKKIEAQELAPRAKKDAEKFKYSRDGAWLDVQWKFDPNP